MHTHTHACAHAHIHPVYIHSHSGMQADTHIDRDSLRHANKYMYIQYGGAEEERTNIIQPSPQSIPPTHCSANQAYNANRALTLLHTANKEQDVVKHLADSDMTADM